MSQHLLTGYYICSKYYILQAFFVITRFLVLSFDALGNSFTYFPCRPPISSFAYGLCKHFFCFCLSTMHNLFYFFAVDIRTAILIVLTFLLSLLARQIFTKPAPSRSMSMFESITDAITWQSITRFNGNQIGTTLLPVTAKPYFDSAETKLAIGRPDKCPASATVVISPPLRSFGLTGGCLVSSSNVVDGTNTSQNVKRGHQRTCSEQSVLVTYHHHVPRVSCDQSALATTTKERTCIQSPERVNFNASETAAESVWLCFPNV